MSNAITLPDLFTVTNWPYDCKVNTHYPTNALESKQWLGTFRVLTAKDLAAFHRYDFPLLTSFFYPTLTKEHHRLAVDIFHWLFLIDELTDIQSRDEARELTNVILGVLRDPYKSLPMGTHALGEMTRDLWSRVREFSVASSADHFQKDLEAYIEAVFDEVRNREIGHIYSSIKEYFFHRRGSSGVKASLDVCMLAVDIPQNVIYHPRIRRLVEDGTDLTWIHNDIYSYNVERARGIHAHNLVTIVMKEQSIGVQDAFDYCGELFHQTSQSFFDNLKNVPTLSYDEQHVLSLLTDGIGYFLTGLHEWSHRTPRYLGDEAEVVRISKEIELADEPLGRQYDSHLYPRECNAVMN